MSNKEVKIINIIDKKLSKSAKYYDYKNSLRTFLEKKCFTKEENKSIYETFHNDYSDSLDLKLSIVIDNLKNTGNQLYKELLLNKTFDGRVCSFTLDQNIKSFKKPGYLELVCDDSRVFKKHFKDVSSAIQSIMKIKSTDVLFNGNAMLVNSNLEIAKARMSYFKISL